MSHHLIAQDLRLHEKPSSGKKMENRFDPNCQPSDCLLSWLSLSCLALISVSFSDMLPEDDTVLDSIVAIFKPVISHASGKQITYSSRSQFPQMELFVPLPPPWPRDSLADKPRLSYGAQQRRIPEYARTMKVTFPLKQIR